MDRSLERLRRCAIAIPLVRGKADRLATCFHLPAFDRDDLEQELWLELLIRWDQRTRTWPEPLTCLASSRQLDREIDKVAASLVRSSSFWRRLRPTDQSADSFALESAVDALAGHEPLRLHELRSDVAAVVSQLPARMRETCHRLMNAPAPDEPRSDANGWPADAEAAALRDVFKSWGLHEYL